MPEIRAERSATVAAPPSKVYEVLADYRIGHVRILPPRYFRDFRVEAGGRGAGTRITFAMTAFGSVRRFRMTVSEPEPGRCLVETDDSGVATSFTVAPGPDPGCARVTISTAYRKSGLAGWVERLTSPAFLRSVYAAELRLLADAVASQPTPPGGATFRS